MAAATKALRGYHPPVLFRANGDLSLFSDAGAPGTFDPAASFDGVWQAAVNLRIDQVRLSQLVAGGAGTTTIELFRRRAGANTLVASVSVAFGAGNFGTAVTAPASEALRELQVGDQVFVHFVARQSTGSPQDVAVQVEFN